MEQKEFTLMMLKRTKSIAIRTIKMVNTFPQKTAFFVIGKQICSVIATQMDSDLYRIPLIVESTSYAFSAAVVLVSAILSSLIIWQRLKQLDLVAVLKTRE
jgi:ABC-type antimicrobial peptide transport system permease subunit